MRYCDITHAEPIHHILDVIYASCVHVPYVNPEHYINTRLYMYLHILDSGILGILLKFP